MEGTNAREMAQKHIDAEVDKEMEQMAADINCNRMKARPRFKQKTRLTGTMVI